MFIKLNRKLSISALRALSVTVREPRAVSRDRFPADAHAIRYSRDRLGSGLTIRIVVFRSLGTFR